MNEYEIPDCRTKLLPCPFCGNDVHMTKKPLWHLVEMFDICEDYNGSYRGYKDRYAFEVVCDKCGAHPIYFKNDTIYRSEEEVISHVVNKWNSKVQDSYLESLLPDTKEEKDESQFEKNNEKDLECIESCIKIIDDADWLLATVPDIEKREKLFSIALEATKLLRKLEK